MTVKRKKRKIADSQRINFGSRSKRCEPRGRAYQFSDGTPADYDPGPDYNEDDHDFDGMFVDVGDR